MAGPPLDYPLSSKLNLSDCSPAVRMISHRSSSIVFFLPFFLFFDRGITEAEGGLSHSTLEGRAESIYAEAIGFICFFFSLSC